MNVLRRNPLRYLDADQAEQAVRPALEKDEQLIFTRSAYLHQPATVANFGYDLPMGLVVAVTDRRLLFFERTLTQKVRGVGASIHREEISAVGERPDSPRPGRTVAMTLGGGREAQIAVGHVDSDDTDEFLRLLQSP